ncbi:hypothetical protein [Nocardioides montaniterrae]
MAAPVIDTPIAALYKAGKIYVPQAAATLSAAASAIGGPVATLDLGAAAAGDPAVMRDALAVLSQVSAAASAGTRSLNDAALALVATADDFVRTDTSVARQAHDLQRALGDPHSKLGLDTAERQELAQARPDQSAVPKATGDRSGAGGDGEIDIFGLHLPIHQDSTPAPTTDPGTDRGTRDDTESNSLTELADGIS